VTRQDWGVAAILLITAPLWIAAWAMAGLLFGLAILEGRIISYFTGDDSVGIVGISALFLLLPLSPILMLSGLAMGALLRERLSCNAEGLCIRLPPTWRGTTIAWGDIVALRWIREIPNGHFAVLLCDGRQQDLGSFADLEPIEEELSARGICIERHASASDTDAAMPR